MTTLLISKLNFPSQFKTIPPCPITIHSHKQLFPFLFVRSLQVLEGRNKVSPEPSLLQAKQSQFPQSFLLGEVLQPSGHLNGPRLGPFKELCVFFLLGAPGLGAVLHMGPHRKSRVEGDTPLPLPPGHPQGPKATAPAREASTDPRA